MRQTRTQALLGLLEDKEPHTSSELAKVAGYRYGASVMILRDEGWVIDVSPTNKSNVWRYQLRGFSKKQIEERNAAPKCTACGRKFSTTHAAADE
jgi:hypothetical protein